TGILEERPAHPLQGGIALRPGTGSTRPKPCPGPGRPPVAGGYRAQDTRKRVPAGVRSRRGLSAACGQEPPGVALSVATGKVGCSPGQMAGTRALVHAETPSWQVAHETLYTAIYAMPRGALRTEVMGGVQSRIEPAFMIVHLRWKSGWCRGMGRAISSRVRTTAR
ncbi:hypothetical protein B2A_14151, partial [mine drainage metagenome]